jgi:hypothetical protein
VALRNGLRSRLGPTYRRWRKRLDNPEVRQARLLATRLRAGELDVLHFGASESQYVAPYDTDQRTLPAMITDSLAPGLSVYSVHDAGYHARLFEAYLEIVARYPVQPVVIVGLSVRFGFSAWAHHPEYGFERSLRALTRIDPGSPPWRFHAPVRLTRESDFFEFDRTEYPTVDGTATIGEFRRTLKKSSDSVLTGDARTRRLFAYHQGSQMEAEYLRRVTSLGARLRELDLAVVVYQLPVPIERGAELLGDALREQVVHNLAFLDEAFIAGYGPIDILQTGTLLDGSEFVDTNDAIEHANERGRMRMTDLITQAVHQQRALAATRHR